jgi:hypothetical protein
MDDQRIIRRPLFGLVDASDGIGTSRICTEAVDCLGGERDWNGRLTKCRRGSWLAANIGQFLGTMRQDRSLRRRRVV